MRPAHGQGRGRVCSGAAGERGVAVFLRKRAGEPSEYLVFLSRDTPPCTRPSISSAECTLSSRATLSWDSFTAMYTAGSTLNLSVGFRENSTKALLRKAMKHVTARPAWPRDERRCHGGPVWLGRGSASLQAPGGNQMCVSHIDVSVSLSLPFSLRANGKCPRGRSKK